MNFYAFIHGSALTSSATARDIDVFYVHNDYGREADREVAAAATTLASAWASANGLGHLPIDAHRLRDITESLALRVRIEAEAARRFGGPRPSVVWQGSEEAEALAYQRRREFDRYADAARKDLTLHPDGWIICVPVPPLPQYLTDTPAQPPVVWLQPQPLQVDADHVVDVWGRTVRAVANVQWSVPAALRAAGDYPDRAVELITAPPEQGRRCGDFGLYIGYMYRGQIGTEPDKDTDERGYVTGLVALRNAAHHAPRLDEIADRLGTLGRLIQYLVKHDPHPTAVQWVLRRCSGDAARLYWSPLDDSFSPVYFDRRLTGAETWALITDGVIPAE